MLKKLLSILPLFLATVILIGHDIIPHHHHQNNQELAEHHLTDHHHDGNHDSEVLGHILSHFIHSADGLTFTTNHNISNAYSKQLISFVAVLPQNFSLDEFLLPPLLYKPPAEQVIYIFPHSPSTGLRAPPVFIG